MRRLLVLLGASFAIIWAQPAFSAHTLDAVVYDPGTNIVRMVVVPTDDAELSDPAFCGAKSQTKDLAGNPCVQVKIAHQSADPIMVAKMLAPPIEGPADLQAAASVALQAQPVQVDMASPALKVSQ